MTETAIDFINERRDFMYVYTAPSARGSGWDVVLRIDGTYADRELADHVAEYLRQRVLAIEGLNKSGIYWMQGPPEQKEEPRPIEA